MQLWPDHLLPLLWELPQGVLVLHRWDGSVGEGTAQSRAADAQRRIRLCGVSGKGVRAREEKSSTQEKMKKDKSGVPDVLQQADLEKK